MKTLYIHVGTPKTGSSALQKFLPKNQEALFQRGFIYRKMPYDDYARETFVLDEEGRAAVEKTPGKPAMSRNGFFLHGKVYKGYEEENNMRLQQGLELVLSWFSEGDNVILTDEHLWTDFSLWDFPEKLRSFAAAHDITVKIIVFLRPQYDYMDSHYREDVKSHFCTFTFREYMERKPVLDELFAVDYVKRLDAMASLYGHDNILPVVYDPKAWSRDGKTIFSVFLGVLGIDSDEGFLLPGKPANESLTDNQTEIMRVTNRLLDPGTEAGNNASRFFQRAGLFASARRPDKGKKTYLDQEGKTAFQKQFEEGNKRVAEEYLGQEELFQKGADSAIRWEPDAGSMQEELILYFGALTRQLYEEIHDLKRENAEIVRYSIGNRICRLFSRILRRKKRKKG